MTVQTWADLSASCEAIRVRLEGRLVLVTCVPDEAQESEPLAGPQETTQDSLVGALVSSLGSSALEPGSGTGFELRKDRLGKPELRVSGKTGPSVSFSRCAGMNWAALAPDGGAVGIDAAHPSEFPHSYPFHRAFHEDELERVAKVAGLERASAAAGVWSAKEAAVKALGCGFHLISPLDLRVSPARGQSCDLSFTVEFSTRVRQRYPQLADVQLTLVSFLHEDLWISLALNLQEEILSFE